MSKLTFGILVGSTFLMISCGSSSITFNDVAGIKKGDGVGDSLTGKFAMVLDVAGGVCIGLPTADEPQSGTSIPLDVDVVQADGSLEISKIYETVLRGANNFDHTYEVGGSSFLDAGEQKENVQRLIRITGTFKNADSFTGTMEERFTGRIDGDALDCVLVFNVSANRK